MRRVIAVTVIVWIGLAGTTPVLHARLLENFSIDRIDAHALVTPRSPERKIPSLASYLVTPARTDQEKVRAIYRLLTHNIVYDTKRYFSGNTGDLSPNAALNSQSMVCDGYADLMVQLGEASGLEVAKITGYSNGYGYSVGDKSVGDYAKFPGDDQVSGLLQFGGSG